jgi:pyrimidine operon attenuation protein / uracil phosphoribosyltransferase
MQPPNPETLLSQISAEIKIKIEVHGAENCALVGIHSGGVWLMDRILKSLKIDIGLDITSGTLDAAMYRDDYNQRGLKAEPKPANIAFDVAGKHIILIDDIFYTGRTTRAAMNELFDYGRPASITLAVLINRGGAELPIAPQIVGAEMSLRANQSLQLSMDTKGKLNLSLQNLVLEKKNA